MAYMNVEVFWLSNSLASEEPNVEHLIGSIEKRATGKWHVKINSRFAVKKNEGAISDAYVDGFKTLALARRYVEKVATDHGFSVVGVPAKFRANLNTAGARKAAEGTVSPTTSGTTTV